MTPKQYAELLEYIYENNSWGNDMYNIIESRNRVAVKYVNSVYDSRDGKVWSVTLRECMGHGISIDEKTFRIENQKDLDKLYEWLDKDRGE